MKESIYNLAYKLHDDLIKDPRIIKLNELENKLNNDNDVIRLVIAKDTANDKYIEMKKYFKDGSNEVDNALKDLVKAKKELDSHPLVREYLDSYSKVRDILLYINSNIFNIINSDFCPKDDICE